jgi:ubiquitin-protein ligase
LGGLIGLTEVFFKTKSFITGGLYHGKLVFPSEFPFKPPSIYIITPNGRFKVTYFDSY